MIWDERYTTEEFIFGTSPNVFLHEWASLLPSGRVLCLADGEGRNSVFLAGLGFDLTAVDSSAVGLAKAQRLAENRGLSITTVTADLADFPIAYESWDGVVSIFCHVPAPLRRTLHSQVVAGLKPGGVLILEAYTPKQLEYGTGGPPNSDLMMTLADLRSEFAGLDIIHGVEVVRDVIEGTLHTGLGAVVQVVARKKPGKINQLHETNK